MSGSAQRVWLWWPPTPTWCATRVIGVSGDHRVHSVAEPPTPYLHFAATQSPLQYRNLIARTGGDADALLNDMRRALLAIEPGLVFISSSTMEASLATSLLPARVGALLALAFGGLGTLLAALGLYGVIAYSVTRRTREIGVRMAIGADARHVLSMVVGQGLVLAASGIGVGGLLAYVAAPLLSGVLYGVSPFDQAAWTIALSTLFVASATANVIPAARALRIDPVTALRTE